MGVRGGCMFLGGVLKCFGGWVVMLIGVWGEVYLGF